MSFNINSGKLDAEQSVVGATLLDVQCYTEAALLPEQFFDPRLRKVWKTIGEMVLTSEIVDPITVAEKINGVEPSWLSSFVVGVGSTDNIVGWATIVRNNWLERETKLIISNLPADPEQALSEIGRRYNKLSSSVGRHLPKLSECIAEVQHSIKNPTKSVGLPTKLGLDSVVPQGLPIGRVTAIFGESGNYKSTVSNNLAWNVAASGAGVLYVSLEDSDELVTQRFLSRYTGVPYGMLAAPVQLSASERAAANTVPVAAQKIANKVIMGSEIPPNIDEIIRVAHYHKYHDDIKAVFIDYVQLLDGGEDREGLSKICRRAQLAAKRDNLAYIIVSQVKQDVDMRDDHRPRITDMLGGSALRTASKLSIGVYRPAKYEHEPKKSSIYYNFYKNHPDGESLWKGLLELHLKKNVVGEDDVIVLCSVHPPTGAITPFDKDML